jgi:hypothetical protein
VGPPGRLFLKSRAQREIPIIRNSQNNKIQIGHRGYKDRSLRSGLAEKAALGIENNFARAPRKAHPLKKCYDLTAKY